MGSAKNRRVNLPSPPRRWVRSCFNVQTKAPGGDLLLYNSFTGNIGAVPPAQQQEALAALGKAGVTGELTGVSADLRDGGFLVAEGTNESRRAQLMLNQMRAQRLLHLILMPSEECNFRCVYCYESFARGKMLPKVRHGIKTFVNDQARHLQELVVSWFGGEPLIALDVIEELSGAFLQVAAKHSIPYTALMTTNGYLLTPEILARLLDWHVHRIQVTVDGLGLDHDRLRILKDGGPSFAVIWNNLRAARQLDRPFNLIIRVNLDPRSADQVQPFIDSLQQEFAGDPRFSVFFRTVGHWGGPNDTTVDVCEGKDANDLPWQAATDSLHRGLPIGQLEFDVLQPTGAVCYAAKPNSFVIGADGSVYKCTVALDNHMNRIGELHPDGHLDLDLDKFTLWVTSDGEHDSACTSCFFRPACHGAACPLVRIESGRPPCPAHKKNIKKVLELAYKQSQAFPDRSRGSGFNAVD